MTNTRRHTLTRAQAAERAGVSTRQISRWAAAGFLTAVYDTSTAWTQPALYDPEEVDAAAERWTERLAAMRDLPLPESDQDSNKTG
jgi:hypothetical protein